MLVSSLLCSGVQKSEDLKFSRLPMQVPRWTANTARSAPGPRAAGGAAAGSALASAPSRSWRGAGASRAAAAPGRPRSATSSPAPVRTDEAGTRPPLVRPARPPASVRVSVHLRCSVFSPQSTLSQLQPSSVTLSSLQGPPYHIPTSSTHSLHTLSNKPRPQPTPCPTTLHVPSRPLFNET